MSQSIKIYTEIIKDFQSKYCKMLSTEQDCSKMFLHFTDKLNSSFKVQLNFDSTVAKALIKRLQEQFRNFYYEESFKKTLQFIKKFSQVLKKQRFIGKRQEQAIKAEIQSYEQDPCYAYFDYIVYLKSATDKQTFRQDFLYRYTEFKDQQETQSWEEQEYQQVYNKFWKQLLGFNPNKKLVTYIYSCFSKFQNCSEMLKPEIKVQIDTFIGQDVGKSQIQVKLNKELRSLAIQNFYENSTEAKQRINKEYELIQKLLSKFSGTKKIKQQKIELRLAKFGSLVSGFGGSDSDLDITILTNGYVNQNNFLNFLYEFLKVQCKQNDIKTGRQTKVQKIDASTPLVQVQIIQNRRQQKFKIDIVVNNVLGVINSKLLSTYAQIPWIKQLGILFKMWAKTNELVGKQLLSSYAVINMLIYFLIKKGYVNLMYNARIRAGDTPKFDFKRIKNNVIEQFEVFYEFKTEKDLVTNFKNVNLLQILKDIFLFYSDNGEHWRKNDGKNIISIDGTYEKQFENQYCFTIKDPFDKPHNPGRAKALHKNHFCDKFRNAYLTFCELQRKENRQLMENLFLKS